jgi:SAM-dependent methyltransferase
VSQVSAATSENLVISDNLATPDSTAAPDSLADPDSTADPDSLADPDSFATSASVAASAGLTSAAGTARPASSPKPARAAKPVTHQKAATAAAAPPERSSPPAGDVPASQARPRARSGRGTGDLFARAIRDYAGEREGRVAVLVAGCTTAGGAGAGAVDTGEAKDGTGDVAVTVVDEDRAFTRTAADRAGLRGAVLGDLRMVPLAQRSFDIVLCSSLLERIKHADLVLDRLISALKPDGLLLVRICDGGSAAGFLDRVLPRPVRRLIWRRRHPGEPGPHPAVYEPLASARGMQSFARLHGLVITERQLLGGLTGGLPPGPPWFLAAQKLVAKLSRGRFTADHEEIRYVLRNPSHRSARILLVVRPA